MIRCAVHVSENGWEEVLAAVGDSAGFRDVELPVTLIEQSPAAVRRAAALGVEILAAHDILPLALARQLSTDGLDLSQVSVGLRGIFCRCVDAGARCVSVRLGAVPEPTRELQERLLRSLLPEADRYDVPICIEIRYPREAPDCRERETAAALVNGITHPLVRFCVNVVLDDPTSADAISDFVRDVYMHLGLVRFHYSTAPGEVASDDVHALWASLLRRHAYRGHVVFCPRAPVGPGAALRHADEWVLHYG